MTYNPQDRFRANDPLQTFGVPVVRAPSPREQRALNRLAAVKVCPNKCSPQLVIFVVQDPNGPDSEQNAFGRCMVCMLGWEVDGTGAIVKKVQADQKTLFFTTQGPAP